MKKIATILNHFNIYQDKKTFKVIFEYNNNSMNLDNIKYFEELTEETACYISDIILNGNNVGTCKNDGCGGATDWYQNDKKLLDLSIEVNELPHPYMSQCKLSIADICDELFELKCYLENVKTIKELKSKLFSYKRQLEYFFKNTNINVIIHTEEETEINTKTYKLKDMPKILKEMGSYFKSCTKEEQEQYFKEIINCGLFQDTCGKVFLTSSNYVEVY